jgi:hypothetical protein
MSKETCASPVWLRVACSDLESWTDRLAVIPDTNGHLYSKSCGNLIYVHARSNFYKQLKNSGEERVRDLTGRKLSIGANHGAH